jgi:diadenosine tetraphosphate (Ap4A) HIT family hydrolase
MEHLYAPWREEYFQNKVDGCVFCYIAQNPNEDEYSKVLYRDEKCFIVMNRYPYTPGHLMVIPKQHTDNVENLEEDIWLHINALVHKCVKMFKSEFYSQGINLGMNLGKAAGAGIAEHIHYHIVPRWERDTNFMTTIAGTRVCSNDFDKIYIKIKKALPKYVL